MNDPFATREAQHYDNPIPSREFILAHLQERGCRLSHEALCTELHLTSDENREALRRRLIAMARDAQLASYPDGTYLPISESIELSGTVIGHKDGYGFVRPSNGTQDLHLSPSQMRKVFDGDLVNIRVIGQDKRGRSEAVILSVLEHNTHELVGKLCHRGGQFFITPEQRRHSCEILIPEDQLGGAVTGQPVMVRITQQPGKNQAPIGYVQEILGDHLAPGMEIDIAIRNHKIPFQWSPEIDVEIAALADEVTPADKKNRVDLRHLPFVTIDGEDAQDFDDAVYCEANQRSGGFKLYVAIADVSHYVCIDSALDTEACTRGNSVYFPGQVVPMLPEKLSNHLCSLRPKVDRLVMVCEMALSAQGKLCHYQFFEGVIHSHARLTYDQVAKVLTEAQSPEGQQERNHLGNVLVTALENLYSLYHVLRAAREQRGAIDFDTTETQIVFNGHRKIEAIVPRARNDAHRIIEETMLCANVAAAKCLEKNKIPSLYRVHEGPSSERLTNLKIFLGELGLTLQGGEQPAPSDFNQLLRQIVDRPDRHPIQTVMLRSLSQAHYLPKLASSPKTRESSQSAGPTKNATSSKASPSQYEFGHFGLNYSAYTHFTSPIRRYPDLLVHRAIRSLIRSHDQDVQHIHQISGAKRLAKKVIYPYTPPALVACGEHCSMTERRADEASRDVVNFLKCEFIQDHVGACYPGVITAVTGFGFFVELQNIYVEGLVHVSSLNNDYYRYDAPRHQLSGESSGQIFALGDEVEVKIIKVNLEDRKIDFELVGLGKNRRQRRKAKSKMRSEIATHSQTPQNGVSKNKTAKGKKSTSNSKKKTTKKTSTSSKTQTKHARRFPAKNKTQP